MYDFEAIFDILRRLQTRWAAHTEKAVAAGKLTQQSADRDNKALGEIIDLVASAVAHTTPITEASLLAVGMGRADNSAILKGDVRLRVPGQELPRLTPLVLQLSRMEAERLGADLDKVRAWWRRCDVPVEEAA